MSTPDFLRAAGRILNSGQARTLTLTGNIHDLFPLGHGAERRHVPIVPFLSAHWDLPDVILVVYELNAPVRFGRAADREKVREAWLEWRTGRTVDQLAVEQMLATGGRRAELAAALGQFDEILNDVAGKPTVALEFLRQLCLCARGAATPGNPATRRLTERLLILIEAADFLLPDGPVAQLNDSDRQRVSICADWFGDPGFMAGTDSVVLLTESRALLNQRLARLPQVLTVEVPAPDGETRRDFIATFTTHEMAPDHPPLVDPAIDLVGATAGLSLHALGQLLRGARHDRRPLTPAQVNAKVEAYIQSELGEGVVEFKKPTHTLQAVVGNQRLKEFLISDFIPRLRAGGSDTISGAAVGGPVGGGKTFIFEAVATELDLPVLVLKNLRSQWFGQTDIIFERLRRVLTALARVLIFVDEADTQFGGVGPDTHETERRLTGKVQGMMSDPALRGRVIWLLITARVHRLSPDLRRPGRAGDLIIPALDPTADDRLAWLNWVLQPVCPEGVPPELLAQVDRATADWSAAQFAALRGELGSKHRITNNPLGNTPMILRIVRDQLSPAISQVRRYQTLQALVNCTRRCLLPDPEISDADRARWSEEIRTLEAAGIQ